VSKIKSANPGLVVRSTASVHPVHSAKCSHSTDGLGPAAKASKIFGPKVASKPKAPATTPQNFKNWRLEIPSCFFPSFS
jgi:hypothetical protein